MPGASLRVAHVIPSIAKEAAGPSYTVPALCDALAADGADVELHVLDGPERERGGRMYQLRTHARSPMLRRVDGSRAMRRAFLELAASFDVFHAHGLWRMPGLYAARAARGARIPLVISPRGMLEPSALRFSRKQKLVFWPAGQGRALFEAACLHATSDAELRTFRALGLRNPVAVIGNGVDIPGLPKASQRNSSRTLLYLGRLHPIKALNRLLDAWAQLEPRHPEWNLRLVGPQERGQGHALRERAARLNIRRVTFADAAFGEDKHREFTAAELYVLPSHSENFGMTIAEALAGGVPCIASRGTPWSGLDGNGCGRWVENTVPSLVASLDDLLSSPPEQLFAMGRRGRSWMERDFSWGARASELRQTYEWLRDPARSRPGCVDVVNASGRRGNWNLGAWWPTW